MPKNWLLLGIALLVAILAIGAVACGDDDDEDSAEPTATEVTVADPTEPPDEADAEPTAAEGTVADPTAIEVAVAVPTAPPDDGGDMADDFPSMGDDVIFIEHTVIVTDGILTDWFGGTLYTFDNDEPGVSNCADACAETWPSMIPIVDFDVSGGDGVGGVVSSFARDDGFTQITYNGQPLYYFSGDVEIGDRNGDGVGGVWHIVQVGG